MRVAALYDVHGNLPALEAVLQEARGIGVDGIVVGGDVLGPLSRETLACLAEQTIPVHYIYGNVEIMTLQQMSGNPPANLPPPYDHLLQWTAEQLDAGHQRLLSSWPKTFRLEIDGIGGVLFCHSTPRDENEVFTRLTPEERLLPIFDGLDVPVVVCGHTHMQFDRMIGRTRVLNAGSVGMPFGNPGADWLLLGPGIELRHTDYDLKAAAERIRATAYPQAEDFASRSILQPPSEAEMLERFRHMELK